MLTATVQYLSRRHGDESLLGEVCRACKLSDKILLLNGSKKIETNGHGKVHPRLKVLASVFLQWKHMLFVTLAFCIFNLCNKCLSYVGHVFLFLQWDETRFLHGQDHRVLNDL